MARFCAWFTYSVLITAVASFASVSYGRPVAIARDAPAAEVINHVEAWIKTHPRETAGYRVLAHIHALAWAYGEKIPLVGTGGRDALPQFTETSTVLVSRTGFRENLWMSDAVPNGNRQDRPVTADDAMHLSASIAAYRKAVELDALDALSELGLGWMLAQQGLYGRALPTDYFGELQPTEAEKATWASAIRQLADKDHQVRDTASKELLAAMPRCILVLRDVKSEDPEAKVRIDAILQGYFALQALDHYRKAYALREQADLNGQPNYQVDSQVSAKAGAQILAVLAQHPEAAKMGEANAVQDTVELLEKKWQNLMMMPQ